MFNEFIINKDKLINNIQQIKRDNLGSLVCAMVKADAYGVGLPYVVKAIDEYVDFYGVSSFDEACKTKSLTNKKILIVGALEQFIDTDFYYTCHSLEDIKTLARMGKKINIHIKVNSGMNRFGFSEIQEFKQALEIIKNSKLELEGLFTHFATTDSFVDVQMEFFNKFVKLAKAQGFKPIVHVDNSFVNENNNHHRDMVRIGFDLYNRNNKKFSSVVEINSKIVQINNVKQGDLVGYSYRFVADKDMQVAVIPVGYADGFSLNYLGMELKLQGKNCKVLNICMDCFMLDVTEISVKKGDVVQILGNDTSLYDYANYSKTSPYEIMTRFANIRAVRKLISVATQSENE